LEKEMPIKNVFGGWGVPVEAKTTAYTVTAADCGKHFSNRAAGGSVTFTLPTPSTEMNGWWCQFSTVAAQAIVLSLASKLIVHANATASTVTTAGTIGQNFRVICDGTGYIVQSMPSAASAATAVTALTIA
jgi:hypothetical protein